MAMEGARQLGPQDLKIRKAELRSIEFKRALQVPEGGDDIEIQMSLSKDETSDDDPWYLFRIFSFGLECTEHCCGRICLGFEARHDGKTSMDLVAAHTPYLDELSVIDNSCSSETNSQSLYESIRKNGISYGPCFQTLNNIRFHPKGAAVANVSLPHLDGKPSSQSIDPKAYIIHPSLLDGFFQLVFPALNEGGMKDLPSMVPSFVRRMVIYPDEQIQSSLQFLRAGTYAYFNGYRGTESNVVATSYDNQLRIIMEGYQTTFVSFTHNPTPAEITPRLLLSHMRWQPDLSMVTTDQCLQLCRQGRAPAESFKSFYRKLSWLVHHYVTKSLKTLHQSPTSTLPACITRCVDYMEQELELRSNDERFSMLPFDEQLSTFEEDVSVVEQQLVDTSRIGEFYVKLGGSLPNVILGNLESDCSISLNGLVDAYFSTTSDDLGLFNPLHKWLALAIHKNPSMRVLEIGPSQGTTFNPLASTLAAAGLHLHHYEYSLVSSEMLAEVQLRLKNLGELFTSYLLDLESDASLQGFDEPPYDAVIALYLLEAPSSSTNGLQNLKRLLKPGGKLILFGSATSRLRTRFMHGIVSSVQTQNVSGTDTSRNHVEEMLLEAGFSGIDVEIRDTEDELFHEMSIFISTTLETTEAESLYFPPITILVEPESSRQLSFARTLKEQLMGLNGCESEISELEVGMSEQAFSARLCVSLLEYEKSFFNGISSEDFMLLKTILSNTKNILWIVKDTEELSVPSVHMVDGLSRCLRSEDVNLRFTRLTLEAGSASLPTVIKAIESMVHAPLDDMEPEYEQRDDMMYINRVIQSPSMNSFMTSKLAANREEQLNLHGDPALVAVLRSPGLLNSITFEKSEPLGKPCGPDEILVDVHAIGLNAKDFQVASGQLNDTRMFFDCSGLVVDAGSQTQLSPGDKVLVHHPGSCRTLLKCRASFAAKVPQSHDFLRAAAMCTPALTAFHALLNLARLEKGETVLIHHAAGPIGQIAIQIAQRVGATVIAAVSTNEESDILQTAHNLAGNNIVPTTGTSFRHSVLRATNHGIVNVVLNFRTKEDFENSIEIVAPFGRLANTAASGMTFQRTLSPEITSKCIAYSTVDLLQMQLHGPSLVQNTLAQVSLWLHDDKITHAGLLDVYGANNIPQALQSFSNGEPTTSVVVDFSPGQTVKVS